MVKWKWLTRALMSLTPAFFSTAGAMTLFERQMECPYDGEKFTATLQGSGTAFDTTLDLMPVGPIQSPWPIAVCPTNGFVFFQDKFSDEELERLRPFVLSDQYQAIKSETPYYRAYWLQERLGTPRKEVSFTLLKATWQVATEPDKYHAYVSELLSRLPVDIRMATSEDESITLQVLQAELLRRVGRFAEAKKQLLTLRKKARSGTSAGLIINYQLMLCDKHDADRHSVSQVMDKTSKAPAPR